MTHNEQLQERIQLIRGAVKGEKISRIPTASNFWTWKILDSDTNAKIMEATTDWSLMEKIVREFHERYRFDYYEDLGLRNRFAIGLPLGGVGYTVNDETGAINAPDTVTMNADEYEEYLENPLMFSWKKVIPRRFPNGFTYEQYRDSIKEFIKINEYDAKITKIFTDEYGVPKKSGAMALSPVEDLFSFGLRGYKGFASDMRRCPEKIDAFIDAAEPALIAGVQKHFDDPANDVAFDVYSVILANSCMNPKQFERFYFRTFKPIIEMLKKYDGTLIMFFEAQYLRLKDFFADVPKGHITVTLEADDFFEARKQCPNICLCGGMPRDILSAGTSEQCVDYAKMVVDKTAGEGLILSQSKMMSFRNDCRRENMLAVQDYILNYKL